MAENLTSSEEYKKILAELAALDARKNELEERIAAILEASLLKPDKEEVHPTPTAKTVREHDESKVVTDIIPDKDIASTEEQLEWLVNKIGKKRAVEIEEAISLEVHRGNSARYKARNVNDNEMVIAHSNIKKIVKNDLEDAYAFIYAESIGVNIDGFLDLEGESNFVNVSNAALYKKENSVSLTEEEQRDLFIRLNEIGNKKEHLEERKEIVDKLVRRNWRLALMLAGKFSFVPFDTHQERQQAAMMGLTKAVNGYHDIHRAKFSTYAWKVIISTMFRESDIDRNLGISVATKEMVKKFERVEAYLLEKYGRQPNHGELAEQLNIPYGKAEELDEIRKNIKWIEGHESFDAIYEDIEDKANMVEDKSYEPVEPEYLDYTSEDSRSKRVRDLDIFDTENYDSGIDVHITDTTSAAAHSSILKEMIENVLSTLSEREADVLRLRFGLVPDGRQRTLKEIGRLYNLSDTRIGQIEAKALRRLRHPSRSRKLKDMMDR